MTDRAESARTPCVVLVCDLFFGMGHLARTAILAEALRAQFRTVLIVVGEQLEEVHAPAGVELHRITRPTLTDFARLRATAGRLLEITTNVRPSAVLVEYFPFGRHFAAIYLLPFLKSLRSLPGNVRVFCALRDLQQRLRPNQDRFDRSVVQIANEYFDGILLHSDPGVTKLEDTFARANELTIPVEYTNYVSRHPVCSDSAAQRSNTVIVSAGGGRGGEALLQMTVAAASRGLLNNFRLRVFAGVFVSAEVWQELERTANVAATDLQLFRWAPDLFNELRTAAVSVSRCGYNTAQDLIASRVPALVIPYATPHEDEQTERAAILARLGLVRSVPEEGLTPELLAEEICRTAEFRPARAEVKLDGAARTRHILLHQIVHSQALAKAMS